MNKENAPIVLVFMGFFLFLLLLGLPLAHYQVARVEEPRLRQRFGQSYADYCAMVPRWLPRPPASHLS